MAEYKCGNCIHADVCEESETLVGFSRENNAYCGMFLNSADVAPVRHGRWIWQTEDVYKCSNCGDDAHVKEVMGKPSFDYCPNCGARIREDSDGKK